MLRVQSGFGVNRQWFVVEGFKRYSCKPSNKFEGLQYELLGVIFRTVKESGISLTVIELRVLCVYWSGSALKVSPEPLF